MWKAGWLAIIPVSVAWAAIAQDESPSIEQILDEKGVADVIVLFKEPEPDAPAAAFQAFSDPSSFVARALSLDDAAIQSARNIGIERATTLEVDRALFEKLLASDQVELVVPNRAHPPSLIETAAIAGFDSFWAEQTGTSSVAGAPVAVAVLDTGFDLAHDFIRSAIVAQACFSRIKAEDEIESLCPAGEEMENGDVVDLSPEAASGCPENVSGCDHGTHVAGIVAGAPVADPRDPTRKIRGLDPFVQIVAIQVFSKYARPDDCYPFAAPCVRAFDSSILQALDHVRALELKRRASGEGIRIAAVNLSLGSGQRFAPCDATNGLAKSIAALRELDIATFIASGNNGYRNAVNEPACVSAAITVGALTKTSTVWTKTNRADASMVDLMAPGVSVYSSVPGNEFKAHSGTSMATPVAAAAFAALRARFPDRSVDALEASLKSSDLMVTDPATQGKYPAVSLAHANIGLSSSLTEDPPTVSSGTTGAVKEFIIDVSPEVSAEALQATIERLNKELSAQVQAGKIEATILGDSNILLSTERATSDRAIIESLGDLDIRGVGGVFENRSHAPLR